MNKRHGFTALGIVISFAVAAGGWALTSALIDTRSDALMSGTGTVTVNPPPSANDETGVLPAVPPKLAGEEIARVLQAWESPGTERPHEPFGNQITMEQAIDAGKAWLWVFSEAGVIPSEQENYKIGDAYLCQNLPLGWDVLDPVYSYWTVSLGDQEMRAVFKINAVTGQVWSAELTLPDAAAADVDVAHVLNMFTTGLGLNPDVSEPKAGVIYGNHEAYASQCLISDTLYANAALRYEKRLYEKGIDEKSKFPIQIKLALSSALSFAWDRVSVE